MFACYVKDLINKKIVFDVFPP